MITSCSSTLTPPPSSPTYIYLYLCSNVDLTGSTIGIAFLRATCGSSAVGITQDTRRSEASVGATASHELGHIMNMNHDDEGELITLSIVCLSNTCVTMTIRVSY